MITFLSIGIIAGLLAGLLGVGGGLVIVPALVFLLKQQGVSETYYMHMAVGTSLATIVVTTLSSVYAHHRRHYVLWPLVKKWLPGIVVGALLGTWVADSIDVVWLKRAFVVFLLFVAGQLFFDWRASRTGWHFESRSMRFASAAIGFVSTLIGIGGGVMTVPFLLWSGYPVMQAMGTSAAVSVPIAFMGALGFIIMGQDVQASLPAHSLGYVYLPAWLGIVATSVFTAPLGAWAAHHLPAQKLRRGFAVLLVILSFYFIR